MKLDRRQIDDFLKNPGEKTAAVLVFGPDEGLVRERVNALVKAAGIDGFSAWVIGAEDPAVWDELPLSRR